jgi:hypothetical protein
MNKPVRMMRHIRLFLAAAIFLAGCAFDLTDVKYRPARLEPVSGPETSFSLTDDTAIHGAPCGYSRTLRKGTRWFSVGTIPEGVVYRSRDQSITVECSNVFEAYLVVSGERLVGFFLPVEKAFSPLSEPIRLAISRQP